VDDERSPDLEEIRERRRQRRLEERARRRRARRRLVLVPLAFVALTFAAYAGAARLTAPDLDAHGPADTLVGKSELSELSFWVASDPATLRKVRWSLDGEDVTAKAVSAGDRQVLDGRKLGEGQHSLTVSADGLLPRSATRRTWAFRVDTKPPVVTVPKTGVTKGQPVRLAGSVDEQATLYAAGRPIAVDDRRFTIALAELPSRPIEVVATDQAGNRSTRRVRLVLEPRRPPVPVRAVHVTAHAWASEPLRRAILELVDQRRINSVELDIKDEAGLVGFAADVPLGRRMGAVEDVYDLKEAVETLHARGVWVIGRLVAFRDPIHATAAWRAGRRSEVVQTPGGGPYAGYGGFTNFADPAVRRYNIDVAKAAAKAGVDDILYDYIRRPDGPRSTMVFPGLRGSPEASIASFLDESERALRPQGVFLGASVFGVAATRPLEVAQDIRRMAREVDYIAPMLYPSHWGPGEYDVASPNAQPYEIVRRSLADFVRQTKGTGARVVPWLQDFSLGVDYGPNEVRAQIRASRDAGIPEFILWDPLVTYTADALDRGAPKADVKPRVVQKQSRPKRRTPSRAAAVHANELGEVPVIMYHQIRTDGGGDYDLTPDEFRRELEQLYREGYRPVRAIDLVTGHLNVPAGKSPVVLTFDDSTKEQLAYDAAGKPKPDTAVGIMLEFGRRHPDFKPAGTFYVNREPFAGVAEGNAMLRYLLAQGFELGNHTDDHIPFHQKDAMGVQRALVKGKRIITRAVPQAQVRTMALPLGVQPEPERLAVAGRWDGESYRHEGVFLVGADPAPSPFSTDWNPLAIPRMRTSPWNGGEPDYGSGFWLDVLKRNPSRRYVSDGDPKTISFPRGLADKLRPAHRIRANAY
jgi:peptidoglycan/xylan/chitin deacetylase (PgdA/CDA1 family)